MARPGVNSRPALAAAARFLADADQRAAASISVQRQWRTEQPADLGESPAERRHLHLDDQAAIKRELAAAEALREAPLHLGRQRVPCPASQQRAKTKVVEAGVA